MKIMSIIAFLPILIFQGSDTIIPPGRYLLQYDKAYLVDGINSEFTLENDRFIMKFPHQTENHEVFWLDDDSFIVRGFTESVDPSGFEKDQLQRYRPSFNIIKQVNDEYHFVLGSQEKRDTIMSGKFVKLPL